MPLLPLSTTEISILRLAIFDCSRTQLPGNNVSCGLLLCLHFTTSLKVTKDHKTFRYMKIQRVLIVVTEISANSSHGFTYISRENTIHMRNLPSMESRGRQLEICKNISLAFQSVLGTQIRKAQIQACTLDPQWKFNSVVIEHENETPDFPLRPRIERLSVFKLVGCASRRVQYTVPVLPETR